MFFLKKTIAALLLPLPVCSLLLIAGLLLLWFSGRQRLGKILISLGAGTLLLFSNASIPNLLIQPLERPYPPATVSTFAKSQVKWIVVLGAGDVYSPSLPPTTQLHDASLARIVEAVRLHLELPETKLVVSEGTTMDNVPVAEVMGKAMQTLGVAEKDIVLETQSRDTEESARFVQSIVGKDRFLLVTSASHMRRSQALFVKLGMDPIAAPTDYESTGPGLWLSDFYPSAGELHKADLALHEYLGLAWAKVRRKI
jgi:uncharacterized SAM-binding protein YcdF (DUF218 family)